MSAVWTSASGPSDASGPSADRIWPSGRVLIGDCRSRLAELDAESIDACITDPPYHLTQASRGGSPRNPGTGAFSRVALGTDRGFMGQTWDGGDVAFDKATWAAVHRVLKPGAHLLVFGGTRTYHRMANAVEDAGFEIRDVIGWCYAQGFPKSLNIAAEIDRSSGASPGTWAMWLRRRREELGLSREALAEAVACTPSSVRDWEEGRARMRGGPIEHILPAPSYRKRLAAVLGYPASEREVVSGAADRRSDGSVYSLGHSGHVYAGPTSDQAQAWDGWGTALKPAWELILVARKPLSGTVVENVLAHGTGAINVDGCRKQSPDAPGGTYTVNRLKPGAELNATGGSWRREDGPTYTGYQKPGRWPTNLVLSHSPHCVALGVAAVRCSITDGTRTGEATAAKRYAGNGATNFAATPGRRSGSESGLETIERWACVPECPVRRLDDQAGARTSGTVSGSGFARKYEAGIYGQLADKSLDPDVVYGDSGPASRFFPVFPCESDPIENEAMRFCPKAPGDERPVGSDGTTHPTVKPLALIRWLVRLVTPPGGVVLDPFLGSGTLAEAAALEGVSWCGIELCDGRSGRPDYLALIEKRMERFARGESPGAPQWMRTEAGGQGRLFSISSTGPAMSQATLFEMEQVDA